MISYANILQGIVRDGDEKRHYYSLGYRLQGAFPLRELMQFLENPQKYGAPLPDAAHELMGLYNISGRQTMLKIFNLSPGPLEELKTWENIADKFEPVLEVNSGIIRKLNTQPMNLSHEQLRSFELMCKNALHQRK